MCLQHTNALYRVDTNPECVPEGFPFDKNHSCADYVPVGHYKCECVSNYDLIEDGSVLSNGYSGEACTQCNWYNHQCSDTIIYLVAGTLIVVAMVSCTAARPCLHTCMPLLQRTFQSLTMCMCLWCVCSSRRVRRALELGRRSD